MKEPIYVLVLIGPVSEVEVQASPSEQFMHRQLEGHLRIHAGNEMALDWPNVTRAVLVRTTTTPGDASTERLVDCYTGREIGK